MPPEGKAQPESPWPGRHFPSIVCDFCLVIKILNSGATQQPPAFLQAGVPRSIIILSLCCLSPVRRASFPPSKASFVRETGMVRPRRQPRGQITVSQRYAGLWFAFVTLKWSSVAPVLEFRCSRWLGPFIWSVAGRTFVWHTCKAEPPSGNSMAGAPDYISCTNCTPP